MLAKETLRKEILYRLRNTGRELFALQGIDAASALRDSPLWSACPVIFTFLSMSTEIDTMPVIKAALEEGKKVFAPRTDPKEAGALLFCPVLSPLGPWKKGNFNIREPEYPEPGSTAFRKDMIIPSNGNMFPLMILTPGLAFDREGNRLGRGKGYYDRFLARMEKEGRNYKAVGFCMDFQFVEKVPAGELDRKVHAVLTGKDLYIRGTVPRP